MDKSQAIHTFWNSFGLPAYDENTVPDDAVMPYITYEVQTDSIGEPVSVSTSLWYRSLSWELISKKTEQISEYIAMMQPPSIAIDGGRMYITKASPFAQRVGDPGDKHIRRMLLNVNIEYFTNY